MAFSDDEEDIVPESVSNYHFENDDKEPVPFAILPVKWSEKDSVDVDNRSVFLRGSADNGLQTIYKSVKAWRFDLTNMKPGIYVLTKDNAWIKLQKPRKSYEELIRTILITLQCFHFVKRNPDASGKSVWQHLYTVFRIYHVKPSWNDMVDNVALIRETTKRDDSLSKSKFLLTFLEDKPSRRNLLDEDIPITYESGFIVDDEMIEDADDLDSDEDYFDNVCAFCDNGGSLLCCEGCCLRSFHATIEDGEDSFCHSLGLMKKELEAMQENDYLCPNCKYKQHQCYACRKLGSSDKSSDAEVFQCVSATCGYFYHPHCVANLLHKGNEAAAEALEKRISSGESFTCPYHKCCVCKQGEDKKVPELQFAVCRRCPKSYHRKCLPLEIAFNDIEEMGIVTRAWDKLLHNRILIYCLDHEIIEDIGTPDRDHIQFPPGEEKKISTEERKDQASEGPRNKGKIELKMKSFSEGVCHGGKSRGLPSLKKVATTATKEKRVSTERDGIRKVKRSDALGKPMRKKFAAVETDRTCASNRNTGSLGKRLYDLLEDSEQLKSSKEESTDIEDIKIVKAKPAPKENSSELPSLNAATEKRLLGLMRDAASEITLDDILKKHKPLSNHAHSSRILMDKTITLGKVEASVEAVRIALKKIEEGHNIEDAKAVCEPEVLNQIFRWKDKLKIYLGPFIHGPRYSSFSRHFTKVDKLRQIVDMLHWYAQDGDMIVDFCCGTNDFSCLMKKKLEETGKRCSYKNYDIFQAKNDFNFERRDWMTVQKGELLPGSKLIMGLNPPFGYRAMLANQFIDKALEFEPKLLVLIVPPETERLDRKKTPFELVWEDERCLSGKSFYLPGSSEGNAKQMDQWNIVSPTLSLWSRPDWATKHREIAQTQGHLSNQANGILMGDNAEVVTSPKVIDQRDEIGNVGTCMPTSGPYELATDAAVPTNDGEMMEVDAPENVKDINDLAEGKDINDLAEGKDINDLAEGENITPLIDRNENYSRKPLSNRRLKKRKEKDECFGRRSREQSSNARGVKRHPCEEGDSVKSCPYNSGQRLSVDARLNLQEDSYSIYPCSFIPNRLNKRNEQDECFGRRSHGQSSDACGVERHPREERYSVKSYPFNSGQRSFLIDARLNPKEDGYIVDSCSFLSSQRMLVDGHCSAREDRCSIDRHPRPLGQRMSVDTGPSPHRDPLGWNYTGNLVNFHEEIEGKYVMDTSIDGNQTPLESEQLSVQTRDGVNIIDHRPYGSGVQSRESFSRPYGSVIQRRDSLDIIGPYGSGAGGEADLRAKIRLYGQDLDSLDLRPTGYTGRDPISRHNMSSVSPPYYGQLRDEHLHGMLGSVTQRYAPPLDEVSHMSTNSFGPVCPRYAAQLDELHMNMNSSFIPEPPLMRNIHDGYNRVTLSPPPPPPEYDGFDPMSFAPRFRRHWID